MSEGTKQYFTDARAKTAVVDNAITGGVTDKAPSQDAVNTALAGKQGTITTSTDLAAGSVTSNKQAGVNLNAFGTNAGETGEARFNELVANGSNYVGLKAPDAVTNNMVYTLPAAVGSDGQVLSTNASGVLSWISPGGGGTVTSVSGNGPISVTNGNSTPSISISPASGSTDGYLSSTDWNTFNNKVGSTRLISAGTGLSGGGDLSADRTISLGIASNATIGGIKATTGKITLDGSGAITNIAADTATTATTATTAGNVTGTVGVGNGGTGATDAAGARTNLGAAASGANSDITSLSGLSTALSVAQGGSGATDATGARGNLGAAASGANSDITSLSGLTTPLSGSQGGTGVTSTATYPSSGVIVTEAGTQTLTNKTITGGTINGASSIGGSTTINTTGSVTASGVTTSAQTGVVLGPFGAAAGNTGEARFNELSANGGNYVGFKAPDAVTNNMVYTLPAAVGSDGQVLSTNASGVLSWISPGGGGTVTSVSGNGPISVTNGNSTPSISISQASGSTDGYLSSTDWNTFNNKVGSTRSISAGTGLSGGGDLSADRTISLGIASNTTIGGMKATTGKITLDGSGTITNIAADTATTAGNVTGTVAVANGGTGATDAAGARGNLGAAASGANSDITSLSGLTTALSVAQGGSGATDAASARGNLGAAASGANSDITSLSGLTTPLSGSQGGTGVTSTATYPSSGVIVTEAGTQTLTNKTITAGTINGASSIGGSTTINTTGSVTASGLTTSAQTGVVLGPFGAAAGNTGEVRLKELSANGNNYVGLKAPDNIAADLVYTLPASVASDGRILSANTNGELSWIAPNIGSVTNVSVNTPLSVTNGSSIPDISISQANGTTNGYLSSSDWTTFNNKVGTTRSISAGTGLSGGGDLSADRTISLGIASNTTIGGMKATTGKITLDGTGAITNIAADSAASIAGSNIVGVGNGGTGVSSVALNGILYGNGGSVALSTATGSSNQVLTLNGSGVPTFAAIADANISASAAIARSKLANGTADHVVINSGTGVLSSEAQLALSRGGTGANLSATGGSGQYLKQTSSGGAVTVGTIPATDIPNLDAAKITTGTLSSSLLPWASPGTIGSTTPNTGAFTTLSATDILSSGNVGASGTVYSKVQNTNSNGYAAFKAISDSGNSAQMWVNGSGIATLGGANAVGISNNVAAPIVFYTNANSEKMRIHSNGFVGIGATSPAGPLEVVSDNLNNDPIYATIYGSGQSIVSRRARGSASAPTAVLDGDRLMGLDGQGHDGSAFTPARAQMTMVAAENFTPTAQGSYIRFYTTAVGTTSTSERMRINNLGNVGIGTTAPSAKLHVYNTDTSISDDEKASVYSELYVDPTANQGTNASRHAGLFYARVPGSATYKVNKIEGAVGWAENFGTGSQGDLIGSTGWAWSDGASSTNYITGAWNGSQSGTGTVTMLNGTDIFSRADGTSSVSYQTGLFITMQIGGSATVQHRKGIYIETPTGTPTGSDYGIYQDASSVLNYFGGKVGIGTDAPSNTLHVLGSLCVKSTAGNCAGSTAGRIYATNTTVQSADLAERMPVADLTLTAGEVVAIERNNNSNESIFSRSTTAYQKNAAGVVSTSPGIELGGDAKNSKPIALAGRVPVNVTLEGGPIAVGDYLVASNTPGRAMKAGNITAGGIIGIALSSYDGAPVVARDDGDGIAHPEGNQVMMLVQAENASQAGIAALKAEKDKEIGALKDQLQQKGQQLDALVKFLCDKFPDAPNCPLAH